jgi:hypothetical protein
MWFMCQNMKNMTGNEMWLHKISNCYLHLCCKTSEHSVIPDLELYINKNSYILCLSTIGDSVTKNLLLSYLWIYLPKRKEP